MKSAVSVGINLFVAFVGLQNAKLIVNSDSLPSSPISTSGATFHSIGVGAILTLVGVLITAILLVKRSRRHPVRHPHHLGAGHPLRADRHLHP